MWPETSSVGINSTNQISAAPQIEGVYPDNARVVVRLAIGGRTVDISQYIVKLVGRKEYDRYSKDLSKYIGSTPDSWDVCGSVTLCSKRGTTHPVRHGVCFHI